MIMSFTHPDQFVSFKLNKSGSVWMCSGGPDKSLVRISWASAFFCASLEVVRLAGARWEGWVMAPNWEAEEVNTLGCCFYWTFHPGAVITATLPLKIYDAAACTSCWKSQVILKQGAKENCSLHPLTSLFLSFCSRSLICFSPPAWPGMG